MCNVTVIHPLPADPEQTPFVPGNDIEHFVATYNRALRHAEHERTESVEIHLGTRTAPKYRTDGDGQQVCYDLGGWLEHLILIRYKDGGKLTIGAIQRTAGEKSEFHS